MLFWAMSSGGLEFRGDVWPGVCPVCHNHGWMRYQTCAEMMILTVLPIPGNRYHYLTCSTCRGGIEIGKEQAAIVEHLIQQTQAVRAGSISVEAYWAAICTAYAMASPEPPPAYADHSVRPGWPDRSAVDRIRWPIYPVLPPGSPQAPAVAAYPPATDWTP